MFENEFTIEFAKQAVQQDNVWRIAEYYDNIRAYYRCKPDPNKFPKYYIGQIIDEDKSVRWNKEQVESANAAYKGEELRLRRIRGDIIKIYRDAIFEYLHEEYSFSTIQAETIWDYFVDDNEPIQYTLDTVCEVTEMFKE